MSKVSINIAPLGMPPIIKEGEDIPVQDIEREGDDTVTYKLPDGITIRLKNVLLQVIRFDDMKDMNGNPVYNIQTQNIVQVISSKKTEENE